VPSCLGGKARSIKHSKLNKMKLRTICAGVMMLGSMVSNAQDKPADTVIIKVGEGSKIIMVIKDKKDLETMKQYNFQTLIPDLITKLEQKDTASQQKPAVDYLKEPIAEEPIVTDIVETNEDWDNEDWTTKYSEKNHHSKRTYSSFNFDLGTNNYLSDGKFPDGNNALYTVKPWGSWYVGVNSVQRTRIVNKFFVEWGLGVSWYNFKFQNTQTIISKDDNSVNFSLDTQDADFKKSKLTATFINASLIPMIDFGSNRRKPSVFDSHNSDSFRIGVGPYVGYRIDSYSKQKFEENGDERKPKDHDNFYLNNFRYGMRLQLGFDDVDLFFNYDLNELFIENKGPKLNAFSFGVTF
jgi:lipopolysaccharide biosynthesis glycosyltransferase